MKSFLFIVGLLMSLHTPEPNYNSMFGYSTCHRTNGRYSNCVLIEPLRIDTTEAIWIKTGLYFDGSGWHICVMGRRMF